MNFEEYLISKKIDSAAFRANESTVWESWKVEFEQLHPNSFTAQKLYLINPVRRKYPLKSVPAPEKVSPPPTMVETQEVPKSTEPTTDAAKPAKPSIPKPVFKPKPKMN